MKKILSFGAIFVVVFLSKIAISEENRNKENRMSASGVFDVKLEPQNDEATPAGRMTIFKEYSGGMVGKGVGQMISKRTENGAAIYSAIEEFEGTVNGKKGSFTLFHNGFMSGSKQSLEIIIVEGSGAGELKNIHGDLAISQKNGTHHYILTYQQ